MRSKIRNSNPRKVFQRERACRGPAAVERVDTDIAPRDGLGASPTVAARLCRRGWCAVIRRRSADSGRPMGSARTCGRTSMSEPASCRPGIAAGKKRLELPHIKTIRMPPIACRIVSPDMYPSTASMTPEIITPIPLITHLSSYPTKSGVIPKRVFSIQVLRRVPRTGTQPSG
jgi:hypothetical protein